MIGLHYLASSLAYPVCHIDLVGGGGRYNSPLNALDLCFLNLSCHFFLLLIFLFILTSCTSKPKYITDSSDYTSFGVDYHDIENMLDDNVKSFLGSDFVKNLEGKKVLAISDIENLTDDDIDIELLSRKFARQIRNSKKFVLTNAIAGSGSKRDKMIKDSRALRNDEEYDQYTTKEKGNLLAPDYSLAGKITQRTKNIGKKVRVDYQFLIVLSDIKTGVVLWDNEEIISKVIARDKLRELNGEDFDDKDSSKGYNQSYSGTNYSKSYTSAYSYKKQKAKKFFKFGPNGKNHIVFGADVGENLAFYSVGNVQDFDFGFPLTLRIGYERDIGEKWALGANFVYIFNFLTQILHPESYIYGDDNETRINASSSRRLGFEIVGSYKTVLLGYDSTIYAGFGLSKDSGSYAVATEQRTDYSYNGWYTQPHTYTTTSRYKVDTLYPLVKFGVMWYVKPAVGISLEANYGWAISKENYINTGVGMLVLGILFRI